MFDILKTITWDISHIIALVVGSILWGVGERLYVLFYMRKRNKERPRFVEKHADLAWAGSVFSQGSLSAPLPAAGNLKVKDLGEKLRAFLNSDTVLHLHQHNETIYQGLPPGPVVWVNSTRISTFFVFTDKKRVLIYDRRIGEQISTVNSQQMGYKNERFWDMFGTKAFDCTGLVRKIPNPSFHDATVIRIDAIPGIAIEDMDDKVPLDSKRTMGQHAAAEHVKINCTVVMLGFCIELSAVDLDRACVSMPGVTEGAVAVYDVHGALPVGELQTSKATLGIKYLRTMYP